MKPKIQDQEYVFRKERIQKMMCRNKLDLIVAYSNDCFTHGQAHARWICNYLPQFEPCIIMIPSQGDMVLVTGAESEEYALTYAKNVLVRVADIFLHPHEEFPYTTVIPFSKIIHEMENMLGREILNVGIAGGDMIPHQLYSALKSGFSKANFSNAEPALMELRAIKTADEIRVIAYAYQIAQAGMNAAIEMIDVGCTEREIAAAAEFAMRSMGAEGYGIMTMVASGFRHLKPILATTTNRKIEKDDLICMTFAPRYEGYHGAIARPVVLGKPSDALQRALDLSMQAQQDTQAVLKPGTKGYKVDAATRRAINAAGLGQHFVYTGVHSVGVIEFEPPILTSASQDEIQENMVLSIDIPLYFNDDFGGFRLENGFLITAEGHRALNDLNVDYLKEPSNQLDSREKIIC